MTYVFAMCTLRSVVAIAAISIGPMASSAKDLTPRVVVTGGQIQGTLVENGGAAFKGIPFAQPPVRSLRWRKPMPVIPWTGVRDATSFGVPCAQSPSPAEPGSSEISKEIAYT